MSRGNRRATGTAQGKALREAADLEQNDMDPSLRSPDLTVVVEEERGVDRGEMGIEGEGGTRTKSVARERGGAGYKVKDARSWLGGHGSGVP